MTAESRTTAMQNLAPGSEEREGHLSGEDVSISQLQADDEHAFDQVFRRFATPLMQYASRMVLSDAVAQDLVMDVFMRLWRDRLTLPADTRLPGYLKVSVRHSCINYLRHNRIEASVQEIGAARGWAPAMGTSLPMPDEDLERSEAKEAVRRAFTMLPQRMRLVMELRWLGEKSHKEIAGQLGMPVKSVENYLGRAMRLLRERMTGETAAD